MPATASPALHALLIVLAFAAPGIAASADPASRLTVPPGFRIATYAAGVEDARQLAVAGPGLVFAGSRKAGRVVALVDADGDSVAEETVTVATDLFMPSGVALHAGDLYVAEVNRILRFPDIARNYRAPRSPEVVFDTLPDDTHHGWKALAFGPDGKLYVPVGVPCNICLEEPPYGTLLKIDLESRRAEVHARGIRNSVGMAWHPETGELWFTDNGRDWLGDDRPSCELNRAHAPGLHFGFPYVHGREVLDPEFGARRPEDLASETPALELGAHVAPVGLAFYRGTGFPAEYRHALFVALHGSWNRSRKSGYRVERVTLDATGRRVRDHAPFVTGWLQGEEAWGRPSDVAELPDGSLLIADDGADRVYRVWWTGAAP